MQVLNGSEVMTGGVYPFTPFIDTTVLDKPVKALQFLGCQCPTVITLVLVVFSIETCIAGLESQIGLVLDDC